MKKYIVTKAFVDKYDVTKRYNPGDELPESLGEDRISNIVKMGFAKVEESETKPKLKKDA